jgi:hypothetical protein
MEKKRKINFQQYVKPKASSSYLIRVIIYILLFIGISIAIKWRISKIENVKDIKKIKEINKLTIELP